MGHEFRCPSQVQTELSLKDFNCFDNTSSLRQPFRKVRAFDRQE